MLCSVLCLGGLNACSVLRSSTIFLMRVLPEPAFTLACSHSRLLFAPTLACSHSRLLFALTLPITPACSHSHSLPGQYSVTLRHGGKRHHVGYFNSDIEAARAYDAAARIVSLLNGPWYIVHLSDYLPGRSNQTIVPISLLHLLLHVPTTRHLSYSTTATTPFSTSRLKYQQQRWKQHAYS
jgi:hypothetical protein